MAESRANAWRLSSFYTVFLIAVALTGTLTGRRRLGGKSAHEHVVRLGLTRFV